MTLERLIPLRPIKEQPKILIFRDGLPVARGECKLQMLNSVKLYELVEFDKFSIRSHDPNNSSDTKQVLSEGTLRARLEKTEMVLSFGGMWFGGAHETKEMLSQLN